MVSTHSLRIFTVQLGGKQEGAAIVERRRRMTPKQNDQQRHTHTARLETKQKPTKKRRVFMFYVLCSVCRNPPNWFYTSRWVELSAEIGDSWKSRKHKMNEKLKYANLEEFCKSRNGSNGVWSSYLKKTSSNMNFFTGYKRMLKVSVPFHMLVWNLWDPFILETKYPRSIGTRAFVNSAAGFGMGLLFPFSVPLDIFFFNDDHICVRRTWLRRRNMG